MIKERPAYDVEEHYSNEVIEGFQSLGKQGWNNIQNFITSETGWNKNNFKERMYKLKVAKNDYGRKQLSKHKFKSLVVDKS